MTGKRLDAGTAEAMLAQGFSEHLRRWAQATGADAVDARRAAEVGARISRATCEGHVCIELCLVASELGCSEDILRQSLLASGNAGTPQEPCGRPLIVDAEGRAYLHRYFDYERRLAAAWITRLRTAVDAPGEVVKDTLRAAFADGDDAERLSTNWQQVAVAQAMLSRTTIISGGPGTGKTTTVVKLLACLLEQNPAARIVLAAPTGKAAARMSDAVRQRAEALPAAVREQLPTEAYTVHRLLGVTAQAGRFRHHAGNPLALDVLVVDEASMLDLALAVHLLEAVPSGARIILLGDKDQLSAVEAGAVFAELGSCPDLSGPRRAAIAELCGYALELPALVRPEVAALIDSTVWLSRSFRFGAESGIGQLARAINQGNAEDALRGFDGGAGLRHIDDGVSSLSDTVVDALMAGYAHYLSALQVPHATPDYLLAAFDRFRVLCALREGVRGVAGLNAVIGKRLRSALAHPGDPGPHAPWYPGRPVMVQRNDYLLKLFNGDIGIAWPDATGELMVHFPSARGAPRAFSPLRLPEHETAYAMTVHKSQGSEFDAVALILPAEHSAVLTRELVYTAVTRARECVTVCGSASVFAAAVRNPTRRSSGLLQRVAEVNGHD